MPVREEASLFALNLKAIAKRERNIGNSELSQVIDDAAIMIDRLVAPPSVSSEEALIEDMAAEIACRVYEYGPHEDSRSIARAVKAIVSASPKIQGDES